MKRCSTHRSRVRFSGHASPLLALLALLIGLGLVGATLPACGDDGGGSGAKPPPPRPKTNKTRGKRGGKGGNGISAYTRVEQVVPEDEAATIRRPFTPRDFAGDITGNDNRDPFRSYVVRQTFGTGNSEGGVTVATTEICTAKNMVAPNLRSHDPRARKSYSLRDLRLAGIVMRGTRGYAIFRDASGYGHLVRKGDCLGKEKARVTTIGAHLVKVEVVAEPGPNQLTQEPQQRKFELYQDELPIDDAEAVEDEDSSEG